MSTRSDIADCLRSEGAVAVRDHPAWTRMLARMAAEGLVVRWLPGVYVSSNDADDLRVRCAAIMLWDPDAVITGLAAAQLTFWPAARVVEIEVHSTRKKQVRQGIRLHRTAVPAEEVIDRQGLRLAKASWVAVHLARSDNGAGIDESLRSGRATLASIEQSLARGKGRRGNRARRPVVKASRTLPWSQGERETHSLMLASGITGWVANHPVTVGGSDYVVDIAFAGVKLAIEFDGREFHTSPQAFERDRLRQNDLVAHGDWTVIRITWSMLNHPDQIIAWIKAALRRLRRRRSSVSVARAA